MNATSRKFEAHDAVRDNVPLLIGLMGCSGSGKTMSALRLATGMQTITGGDIYFIDTESKRALHYADDFKFKHVPFEPPFGSLDYLAAMQWAVAQGAKTIIVDSFSHEHQGEGGYLQTQEAEVQRMAGDDYAKRERVKMAGWIKPSMNRQRMIAGLLQLNANMIFCFRAKEKVKPVPGKQPQELGFMPIAGEEFLFEMTVNCLLMPKANGVPTWRSDQVGERLMMKLPKQFADTFSAEKPLDETTGRELAEWARGSSAPPAPPLSPGELATAGAEAAARGTDALREWYKTVPKKDRPRVALDDLRALATQADKVTDEQNFDAPELDKV